MRVKFEIIPKNDEELTLIRMIIEEISKHNIIEK